MAAAPGSAETHSHYAFYLIARGRCAEAVASDDHARSLDPLSPMIGKDRAVALWMAHRYAEAIDGYRQTLELEPHFEEARRELALLHAFLGDVDAALAELEREATPPRGMWQPFPASDTDWPWRVATGRPVRSSPSLKGLRTGATSRPMRAPSFTSASATTIGLSTVLSTPKERSWPLVWLGSWPLFDPIRSTPRFRALLAHIGLA